MLSTAVGRQLTRSYLEGEGCILSQDLAIEPIMVGKAWPRRQRAAVSKQSGARTGPDITRGDIPAAPTFSIFHSFHDFTNPHLQLGNSCSNK